MWSTRKIQGVVDPGFGDLSGSSLSSSVTGCFLVAEVMLGWLCLKALCSKTIPYNLKPSKWG